MKIYGVISEYNPFHNGHLYMLHQMRENGAEYIVTCMSGNFTQRGDFALYDKYTRTRAALMNGVDLVVELPVTHACTRAEQFAYGGVRVLSALGCVDKLCFGSECGNIEQLQTLCNAVTDDNLPIQTYLDKGMTFAAAREKAVQEIFGSQAAEILHSPNDILGIEYLKALRKLNSSIEPCTIKRIGVAHDSSVSTEQIASASYLRGCVYSDKHIKNWIPENTVNIYQNADNPPPTIARFQKMEQAILYRLRMMSRNDLSALPDMSEGLENRLYNAIHSANTIEEIMTNTKSKRYTMARIRRSVLHALLGLTQENISAEIPYIRVLGFTQKGRDILRQMRTTAALPIVMKYGDLRSYSETANQVFELESRCDDIFALSGKKTDRCGKNYIGNMIIL